VPAKQGQTILPFNFQLPNFFLTDSFYHHEYLAKQKKQKRVDYLEKISAVLFSRIFDVFFGMGFFQHYHCFSENTILEQQGWLRLFNRMSVFSSYPATHPYHMLSNQTWPQTKF
jgi:hypothetical protein